MFTAIMLFNALMIRFFHLEKNLLWWAAVENRVLSINYVIVNITKEIPLENKPLWLCVSSKLTCLSFSTFVMFYWFIYLYMANKKNKIRNKRKRKNARNEYAWTKKNAFSEQNNGTVTRGELSSPTVT